MGARVCSCRPPPPLNRADGAHCRDYVPNGLHVNAVDDIARLLRREGFNAVRLQWCATSVQEGRVAAGS